MQTSIHNRHFLLRRLHSLFGLLPVGGFLIFHLWENSQSRFGKTHYNEQVVGWLQSINYLTLVEIFFIALPLLFHAVYGLVILYGSQGNWNRYPWLHNRFYWLQRLSGIGILLFLLLHVGWTRILGIWQPDIRIDLFSHMQELLINPYLFLLYLSGLLLAVFHLCNGLWTMAISWGLTTSVEAQRIWFYFCMLLALLLGAMGLHGMLGFLP
ncbi:MAG: succinate dehydrogenase [gamma proteobacterium symbiont of Ctena orbiculata]|nr:succinate dehydrogenase [Candidatus Thiodiazotropha taylori]PUB85919.1 MAG: succinate dehydrogenase [gamma proteobacterium symbiont of Ctena orbiculata]MBT2995651.1 succinate dehydrogenase [Candidatus Thiodiazotropha taylori]MBT2999395.1 succinate dehydrogenase [Candidatus Thiodiazotropha taylori]MBV2106488.1 succinate dehydrogenase [Candidatus Thiodiazotropha taylori]